MDKSGRRREEVEMFRSRGTAAKLYFAGRMAVRLVLMTRCVDSVLDALAP